MSLRLDWVRIAVLRPTKWEEYSYAFPEEQDSGNGDVKAAIISSVTDVALAVGQELLNSLGGTHKQVAVVENLTSHKLVLQLQGKPIHGAWESTAPAEVTRIPSAQTMFDAWIDSGEAPTSVQSVTDESDLNDAQKLLLKNWIQENESQTKPCTSGCGLTSKGAGVEALFVYQCHDWAIAFYISTPDIGGEIKAGALICSADDMIDTIIPASKDQKLTQVKSCIRAGTDATVVINGVAAAVVYSTGASDEVTFEELTVKAASGETSLFSVQD